MHLCDESNSSSQPDRSVHGSLMRTTTDGAHFQTSINLIYILTAPFAVRGKAFHFVVAAAASAAAVKINDFPWLLWCTLVQ